MGASSVTGVSGIGAVGYSRPGNGRGVLIHPRVVASGSNTVETGSDKFTVIFPRALKSGIDNYCVMIMVENPLPTDGGSDSDGSHSYTVTKLDDRFTLSEDNWVFDADVDAGNMKGFVAHTGAIGGGEGSRDSQVMWAVMTIGYDSSEFAVE